MNDKSVILVVDDQPSNIELLEAYLIPLDYEITRAANGEEALEIISENNIDLILLDVMMPGMDGFEVIRRVRLIEGHQQTPIILITALRETEDRVTGIEAGCDDFISKPVDKMELLARVRSLLKIKAANDLLSDYRNKLKAEVGKTNEILQKTLQGSIKILTDILAIINPDAFNTAQHARKLMHNLCERLQLESSWEYEIAAMLSQIGLSTLPSEITDKHRMNQGFNRKELLLFNSHPGIAQKLIKNIPRLEDIAEAIGLQMFDFTDIPVIENKRIASMARMLKLTIDFAIAYKKSNGKQLYALAALKKEKIKYDPKMLEALETDLTSAAKDFTIREILSTDIVPGMVLASDILDERNMLIIPRGTEITEMYLQRLLNFIKSGRRISNIMINERTEIKILKPVLSDTEI